MLHNDTMSRNDTSGVAGAGAGARATIWRESSVKHTDHHASFESGSNHNSLRGLRAAGDSSSDTSQQSLVVSLEKFCGRTLLPHVSQRGDSLLRVSAKLKAVLPSQHTISDLNKTLLAEARRLGITITPPVWPLRSSHSAPPPSNNVQKRVPPKVWTQGGIKDRDTITFLERALGFCRRASLATEPLPSGGEHHQFCRRVGFVHIPKTVCSLCGTRMIVVAAVVTLQTWPTLLASFSSFSGYFAFGVQP